MITYLFTSSYCTQCPPAKEYVQKNDIEVVLLEVDTTPEHMMLAQKYGVAAVPQFVEVDEDGTSRNFMLSEYRENHSS